MADQGSLAAQIAVAALLATPGASQSVMEQPWRLESGALQARCGEEWLSFFRGFPRQPSLVSGDWFSGIHAEYLSYGPFLLCPLVLTHDGGAAAIDDASIRVRKLGLQVPFHPDLLGPSDLRGAEALVRVRHLGQYDVVASSRTIAAIAASAEADAHVVAAARSEILKRPALMLPATLADHVAKSEPRSSSAGFQESLVRLPDSFVWVASVRTAELGTAGALLGAWRQLQLEAASSSIMELGAALDDRRLHQLQRRMDLPGQIPYELAVVFGNWRVDYASVARLKGGDGGWWVYCAGAFEPGSFAAGLRREGFAVAAAKDSEVTASGVGWSLRCSTTSFEAWTSTSDVARRGGNRGELLDKFRGAREAWMRASFEFAPGNRVVTIDMSIDMARGEAVGVASCKDESEAAAVYQAWSTWRHERRCSPEERVPGTDWRWDDVVKAPPGIQSELRTAYTWRKLVQSVTCKQSGPSIQWNLNLRSVTAMDIVRLLSVAPKALVTGY